MIRRMRQTHSEENPASRKAVFVMLAVAIMAFLYIFVSLYNQGQGTISGVEKGNGDSKVLLPEIKTSASLVKTTRTNFKKLSVHGDKTVFQWGAKVENLTPVIQDVVVNFRVLDERGEVILRESREVRLLPHSSLDLLEESESDTLLADRAKRHHVDIEEKNSQLLAENKGRSNNACAIESENQRP